MGGLRHTAFDTIEDLRRNLRDRYKDCHAVLKELIQNADDAGATQLHIAWVKSIPGADHPLLHGPLLLILNNAKFTFLDSYAIHLAGTGSKGHEEGKIGKFGLGLKSVFHLCEAFFYFSDRGGDVEPADAVLKEFGRTGILNPWFGERYAEWNAFPESDQSLLRALSRRYVGDDAKDWFGLCLPLRKRAHCQITEGDDPAQWAIEPRYYGDSPEPPDDVFADRRLAGIQPIMPLMSTLRTVRFWSSDSHTGTPSQPREVSRHAIKHVDWRGMPHGRSELAGTIALITHDSSRQQLYAGVHELLSHEVLSKLSHEEDWPHTDSQTATGRQRKPAVARQHAGVVVIEQTGAGFLRVDRAVFLPLGDPPHPECRNDSQHAFDLILHGYFFVDAGRLGVDFAPEGEPPTVRQKWNRTLYEDGTLPLLIPALTQYATAIRNDTLQSHKLCALTDLIARSNLWEEHRARICKDASWLLRIDANGGRWCEVPRQVPIVYLPGDPTTDPSLPFELFPALTPLGGTLAFSFRKLPRLVWDINDSWPHGLVPQMFQSVPLRDIVVDETKLAYLCATATDLCHRDTPGTVPSLIQMLRSLFRDASMRDLRTHTKHITALIQLLPISAMLALPFKMDLVRESERLFETLVAADTDVLPVPDIFVATGTAAPSGLSTSDARTLLAAIAAHRPAGAQEEAFHTLVGQCVSVILQSWAPGADQLLNEFGDLAVFYVRDFASDSRVPVSGNQLNSCHAAGLLFSRSSAFCRKLQACLLHNRVLFVGQPEVAAILVDALGPLPACDATACAEVLARGEPLVTTAEPRADILRGMLPALTEGSVPSLRKAMRYLLHGRADRVDDASTLFVDRDDAWSALASAILKAGGEGWRLIPEQLTLDLAPSHAARLSIHPCSSATVPALRQHATKSAVDCADLLCHPDWIEQIIREWPEAQLASLRRLALFTRSDGTATPITDETFILGTLPLPPASVFPNLVLVRDPTGALAARSLAPSLSPVDVLRKALSFSECEAHWKFILESIPSDVPDDLRRDLRIRRWLPGPTNTAFAPGEIVCRYDIAHAVRLLREAGRRLLPKADLPTSVTTHPRWPTIDELCPRGEDLYRSLGDAIRGVPVFAIGEQTVHEADLNAFIDLFAGSSDVLPAARLFGQLRESGTGGVQWIARHLLPATQQSLPCDRAGTVFAHIAACHESASSAARPQYLQFFNRVLREASSATGLRDTLASLRLLNAEGSWRPSSLLAVSGHNVAASHLLHPSHADVLRHAVIREGDSAATRPEVTARAIAGHTFDPAALAESARLLGDYLESWRSEDVPDDAIAAVVAMLGDNDGFPELYENLRDSRPLAVIRSMFSWRTAGPGWQLRDFMGKQHFCIIPADATTVEATNLLGHRFSAALSGRLVSLVDGFDGRDYYALPQDHRCYVIRLRQIDPHDLPTDEKLELLACTVQAVRSLIHRQSNDEFAAIWSQITHVGQLDIEIAQALILESSAMLLETQLSVRHADALRRVFNAWHRVRQHLQTASTANERQLADAERGKVLEDLRSLLVNDPDTQQLLLKEICKRLDAASYDQTSIPFELFQNGDDAVVELESLCESDEVLQAARPAELRCRFTAETDTIDGQAVLRFIHWGRGINQFRVGTSDGREGGFDRDLERMLVLQGSGKDDAEGDEKRTGKFGLGFKSVFFVSDSPRVLSGSRSRFRVLGGVYPSRLSDSDEKRLEAVLREQGDPRHKGTVIELPLRDTTDAALVLDRFRSLAGYSVVFARRLRHCTVGQAGRRDVSCHWSPKAIAPGVEIGSVSSVDGRSTPVMVFRLGHDRYGTILLATDRRGVCSGALHGLPEVWVTTPTQHRGAGGVLVNGAFDVNPGRTQLRTTAKNDNLALDMGREFGEKLCDLHRSCRDVWLTIRPSLGCADATWEEFWASLWTTCAPHAGDASGGTVIQRILFGSEHCGVLRLIHEAAALPTGLPDRYGCLTSVPQIAWSTRGILAEEDVWTSVAKGRWASRHLQPGEVVASIIGAVLDRVCKVAVPQLTLAVVLDKTLSEAPFVSPEAASDLGTFIFAERLREMTSNRNWANEEKQIREVLATVKFRSEAGEWSPAAQLLIDRTPQNRAEERRRAAFAPAQYLLSREYDDTAMQFFLACRKEMQASAEQMVQWLLDASALPQRQAGLEYLEQGELSHQMQQRLSERAADVERSWLAEPGQRNAAMPADPNRQAVIMGKLGRSAEFVEERTRHLPPTPEIPQSLRPPKDVLADIVKWWRCERDHILALHDARVFPGGQPPAITFSATADQLARDVTIRREWMILFMRGAMHRIGRVTDFQNRDFLHLCIDRGWLDVLSGPTETPSAWFAVMDDYLDSLQGDAQYFQWMNQFLAYYQLARWLPAYVRAFEAVSRPGVNLDNLNGISDIANLRTSHVFARSTGFDAPPCSRTLGLGSHFVLRETLRARFRDSPGKYTTSTPLRMMAYVPTLALRRLLAGITGKHELLDNSAAREIHAKRIASLLSEYVGPDATFDGCFDIPLLALMWPQFRSMRDNILGGVESWADEAADDFLEEAATAEGGTDGRDP